MGMLLFIILFLILIRMVFMIREATRCFLKNFFCLGASGNAIELGKLVQFWTD